MPKKKRWKLPAVSLYHKLRREPPTAYKRDECAFNSPSLQRFSASTLQPSAPWSRGLATIAG